ncbi:MAG: AbgT family transporter [Bacteroidota bacterium]
MTTKTNKKSFLMRFLNALERGGNALPHPATLFALFAVLALILSGVGHWLNWQAIHPGTEEVIEPVNLLSREGLHRIMVNMVTNFTDFAPLGIVLVAMLGIGIAESSGMISAMIKKLVLSSPKRLLTFIIVLSGVLSNVASSVGYVLLVPLAGIIFMTAKRHPIAGMAAAFAGVSGGFSANLVLGTIDPLLAGLSQEAARIVDPTYVVNPTANYFFMIASTFMIAAGGTWVTERVLEPRLGPYTPPADYQEDEENANMKTISPLEKKGLRYAGIITAAIVGLLLWGMIPADGFLRGMDGDILTSPVLKGVVSVIFVLFGLTGLVFGFVTKKFKSDADVMKGMGESMKSLGMYIVLVFFAAQFVAFFKWSNLGLIIAIKGANGLMATDLGIIPLMILFILLSGTINLMMGSASAKWAIMAPIFIPMFMFMGYSPELSQVVYRIGDSVTNIISPMMSFFALIIAFMQKYDPKAGIGTIIATMMPYSLAFFLMWVVLLVIWIVFGLPLGPDATLHYAM